MVLVMVYQTMEPIAGGALPSTTVVSTGPVPVGMDEWTTVPVDAHALQETVQGEVARLVVHVQAKPGSIR